MSVRPCKPGRRTYQTSDLPPLDLARGLSSLLGLAVCRRHPPAVAIAVLLLRKGSGRAPVGAVKVWSGGCRMWQHEASSLLINTYTTLFMEDLFGCHEEF